MNIDKIEKMDEFPSFLKYIKMSVVQSFYWIVLIFIFTISFFSFITGVVFLIILAISEYIIDKKIFSAFQVRKYKLT